MKDGRVIIDRDPSIFKYVLQFLINGHKKPKIDDEIMKVKIVEEFMFWNMPILYDSNIIKPDSAEFVD